jgi:TRAP-type mannitol/chloroaromatic compound transport system substrate-binding protein
MLPSFPILSSRMRYLTLLLIIATLTGCSQNASESGGPARTKERKARIELASFIPASVTVLGEQIVHIAEELEQVSGDSISLEIYDPGALVGALEILDAVSDGKIDAGYGSAGFWAGKIPASPLFSAIPFGPDSSEFMAWLYSGNGLDLYQEMYDQAGFDVKVLVCSIIPPETSGWFSKEINSAADLDDLKMRFFGLGGIVMGKLGVSVSVQPGAEIFPALEKGVIDATEYALPSIDENQGFHKLVNYNYFPGWHQQSTTFEIIVNRRVWDNLSPTQQAQFESVCKAGIVHSIAYSEATQSAAIKRNQERGVQVKQWSPEMLNLFRETWEEVVEEQAAKDPFFKKAWTDLKAFREEYASWGKRAYIPR